MSWLFERPKNLTQHLKVRIKYQISPWRWISNLRPYSKKVPTLRRDRVNLGSIISQYVYEKAISYTCCRNLYMKAPFYGHIIIMEAQSLISKIPYKGNAKKPFYFNLTENVIFLC